MIRSAISIRDHRFPPGIPFFPCLLKGSYDRCLQVLCEGEGWHSAVGVKVSRSGWLAVWSVGRGGDNGLTDLGAASDLRPREGCD